MNDLENRSYGLGDDNNNKFKFGISPLHARIKFMEFILSLAYRLILPEEFRQKGLRLSDVHKDLLKSRKQHIQGRLKKELNLVVDMPEQGFGSTNDGNTARRFFESDTTLFNITGIRGDLIYQFRIILIAINMSEEVDPEKFEAYTLAAAKIIIVDYNWWPMSPTVHKVLMHGHVLMSHAILPLGQLSEEAQEHRNKDFKTFKLRFSRRNSRQENFIDIFNRFLISSDPLISHLRSATKMKSKARELPQEVLNMLKIVDPIDEDSSNNNNDEMI